MAPRKTVPIVTRPDLDVLTADDLLKKITGCLLEHNMVESDIGIGHDYWEWLNRYRLLRNP